MRPYSSVFLFIIVLILHCTSPSVPLKNSHEYPKFHALLIVRSEIPDPVFDYSDSAAGQIYFFDWLAKDDVQRMMGGVNLHSLIESELKDRAPQLTRNLSVEISPFTFENQIEPVGDIDTDSTKVNVRFDTQSDCRYLLVYEVMSWGFRVSYEQAFLQYRQTLIDTKSQQVIWQYSSTALDSYPAFFRFIDSYKNVEQANHHASETIRDSLDKLEDYFGGQTPSD